MRPDYKRTQQEARLYQGRASRSPAESFHVRLIASDPRVHLFPALLPTGWHFRPIRPQARNQEEYQFLLLLWAQPRSCLLYFRKSTHFRREN
jgi:hypothetical protein